MNYSPRVKATDMHQLFDHKPLQLNDDDYQRVCQIPKRKVCAILSKFLDMWLFIIEEHMIITTFVSKN